MSEVVELSPGKFGAARWCLDGSEPFFAGHFPGRPIVPGVLISESLAQLAGLVVFAEEPDQAKGNPAVLSHVDMRYTSTVAPPVTIELHASVTRSLDNIHLFSVQAMVGGQVVARGELSLAHQSDSAP
jgi:3-hydroxyacyl-[acyl-carrier-protein] dehydratase